MTRTGQLGQPRLYTNGVFATPDGKARFAADAYAPVAEPRSARYPFSLHSGRLRDQWHGMTRTGALARLFGHVPEPVAWMHPQDMARRSLVEGQLVRIASRQGEMVLPLAASERLGLGQVDVPMHWGSGFVGGQAADGTALAGVNALTTPAFCTRSKQPELKHAAVRVAPAELPWTLLALAWLPPAAAARARQRLAALLPHFGFAACVPFGREHEGVMLRAAARGPVDEALLADIEALLALDTPDTLRLTDRHRGQRRAARLVRGVDDQVTLQGFLLAGDTQAEAWIRTVLEQRLPADSYGRLLLAPGAQAPIAVTARSPQVCTCFNVSEAAITDQLQRCEGDDSDRLAQLQSALRCGTNCGSCIPELRRLVRATQPRGVAA